MAYNEKIAARIRASLKGTKNLEEKKMFGGIAFLINGKMCVGVNKDHLMVRCLPELTEELLSKEGAKPFNLSGKSMKGWLLVDEKGTKNKKDFDWWMQKVLKETGKLHQKNPVSKINSSCFFFIAFLQWVLNKAINIFP